MRSGDNKGALWPTKQILTYPRKLSTAKAKINAKAKDMAKAKAKAKAQARIRMQQGIGARVLGANLLA